MKKDKSACLAVEEQESSSKSFRLDRKIKKQKKKKREVPQASNPFKTGLQRFLQGNSNYFAQPSSQSTRKLRERFPHPKVIALLDRFLTAEDLLFNLHLPRDKTEEDLIHNQMARILAVKNLKKSFSEVPIDFFNYHKANECFQKNNFLETDFEAINSIAKFRQYVSSRKPKVQKADNRLLATACSACLTEHSELWNPMENCPECHMRMHRHCQNKENRCHRCRYNRMGKCKKAPSYCYICERPSEKGLMILTVTHYSPHSFAHVYCLLLHQFWSIERQAIVGQYHTPRPQDTNCIFCANDAGHFFSCSCCAKRMHGICAYLHGCSLAFEGSVKSYVVRVNCCGQPKLRQRLSIERKFKMNYEKIIFREDEELYSYISSK